MTTSSSWYIPTTELRVNSTLAKRGSFNNPIVRKSLIVGIVLDSLFAKETLNPKYRPPNSYSASAQWPPFGPTITERDAALDTPPVFPTTVAVPKE